jgi:hypothetical protein
VDAHGRRSVIALLIACAGHAPETRSPVPSPTPLPTTACDPGLPCNPIPIDADPYVDARDSADAPGDAYDSYACAPDTDEGGPEWWYAVDISEPTILAATVVSEAGADIDVHVLSATDAESCVTRDHEAAAWVVGPGTWYVVADTWVDDAGVPLAGGFTLTVERRPLGSGPCATNVEDLRMFWDDCDPAVDCDVRAHTDGAEYPFLHLPSVGEVVLEAHLVTEDEDFPDTWPTSFTDQIDRHYALSEGVSGYAMTRDQPWAPAGEGGSEYGQGATGAKVPADAEAWYVNMYWRDRPPGGTRMILIDPFDGDAVVTAAGYETGPGANTAIGGAAEEVHHALGTDHRDRIVMGFAVDQSLPWGPIDCW